MPKIYKNMINELSSSVLRNALVYAIGGIMSHISNNTKQIALLGLMLAIMIVISTFEHLLPTIPGLPPVKLGLANIIVMFAAISIGKKEALVLTILKSLFIFLLRGTVASIMSICGGLISVFAIIILLNIFGKNISYVLLSIGGALAHNIGQLVAASLILSTIAFMYTTPLIVILGVITGGITGVLLGAVMPVFSKIFK